MKGLELFSHDNFSQLEALRLCGMSLICISVGSRFVVVVVVVFLIDGETIKPNPIRSLPSNDNDQVGDRGFESLSGQFLFFFN